MTSPLYGSLGPLGVSRRRAVAWTPGGLLDTSGGFWWPGGTAGLYTDTGLVTPVSASGQVVAGIASTAPPTASGTQETSGARPTWTASGGEEYLSCDGGDSILTNALPTAAVTLACKIRPASGTVQVIFGAAEGGSTKRSFLGISPAGQLAGGVGGQGVSVITGGASIQNQTVVGLLRFNGTTVELWLDGTPIYSQPQNDTSQGTYGLGIGAGNFGGTATAPYTGRIYSAFAAPRYLMDGEVAQLMDYLA